MTRRCTRCARRRGRRAARPRSQSYPGGSSRLGPRHRRRPHRETATTDRLVAISVSESPALRANAAASTLRKICAEAVASGVLSAAMQSGSHRWRIDASGCPSSNWATVSAEAQRNAIAPQSADERDRRAPLGPGQASRAQQRRCARCHGAGSAGAARRNTPGSLRHKRRRSRQIALGPGTMHSAQQREESVV